MITPLTVAIKQAFYLGMYVFVDTRLVRLTWCSPRDYLHVNRDPCNLKTRGVPDLILYTKIENPVARLTEHQLRQIYCKRYFLSLSRQDFVVILAFKRGSWQFPGLPIYSLVGSDKYINLFSNHCSDIS